MFFLLRLTFWMGVVCVLLPSGGNKTASLPVDTLQAVSAAGAAYSDISGFCERQPGACVVGGQVASALGQRAQDGAKTIVEFISTKMNEQSTASTASHKVPTGTLTPADLGPAFQGATQGFGQNVNHVPLPPVAPRREAQNRRPSA